MPPRIDVRKLREKLKISQSEFAGRFGINIETLRKWEQGQREPHGPALILLAVISYSPEVVSEAISAR